MVHFVNILKLFNNIFSFIQSFIHVCYVSWSYPSPSPNPHLSFMPPQHVTLLIDTLRMAPKPCAQKKHYLNHQVLKKREISIFMHTFPKKEFVYI